MKALREGGGVCWELKDLGKESEGTADGPVEGKEFWIGEEETGEMAEEGKWAGAVMVEC
jgi:hypothetical protein